MLAAPAELVSSMASKCTFLLHHTVPRADVCGAPLSASLCVATDDNFLGYQLCAHLLWIHSDLVSSRLLTRIGALESCVFKVQVYISFFVHTIPFPVSE